MRLLSISLFLLLLNIPGLVLSQSWDIEITKKFPGSITMQNSRYIDYSNSTIKLGKSIFKFGISFETYEFFDEVALVAYNYNPPLVNKVPGNQYLVNYLGMETGLKFTFLNYFNIESGVSAALRVKSNVKVLPYFDLNTGNILGNVYDINQTELYFSNTNLQNKNWNLSPIVIGLYQSLQAKIDIYKNVNLIGSLEHKYMVTPLILDENLYTGFFDNQETGFRSLFLVSIGIGYSF